MIRLDMQCIKLKDDHQSEVTLRCGPFDDTVIYLRPGRQCQIPLEELNILLPGRDISVDQGLIRRCQRRTPASAEARDAGHLLRKSSTGQVTPMKSNTCEHLTLCMYHRPLLWKRLLADGQLS
jgi:hypothetical protein